MKPSRKLKLWPALLLLFALPASAASTAAGPAAWTGDLRPIDESDWNRERAAHLLERAGFGGTPEEIDRLAAMTVDEAVRRLVYHKNIPNPLPDFDHSGVHDPGIEPFPPSRPAATTLAKETGEAIGVKVKPSGNRRLQPVVDRFFYWLRASMLESHRVAYWWGNRMLTTNRPLEEKMTLFWHGHFATSYEAFEEVQSRGQVDVMTHSKVLEITPDHVVLQAEDGRRELANDVVIVCCGGVMPNDFLHHIGVEIETRYGTPVS